MSQPTYRVQSRIQTEPQRHAVIRTGPRGGTKLIGVWADKRDALRVAGMLNTLAGSEVIR